MTRIHLLLVFIDCFLTQLVFSQYSNNEAFNRGYNQMDGEEEATNEYNSHRFDAHNQQQRSGAYPSEYKETPMPYQFEYNTDDGYGNKQDRHEKADEYGNVVGSYGYMDANGVYRKVHYTAGPEGFKAKINSNEPFLKHSANPADVMLFVEDPPHNVLNSVNEGRQQTNSYRREEQQEKGFPRDEQQMKAYPRDEQQMKTYPRDEQQMKTYPRDEQQMKTYPRDEQQMKTYPRDEQQMKTYSKDVQQIDNYDDNDSNQMRDQIYRAAANRVRAHHKRYDNNYDNGFSRMKPFLNMLRSNHMPNRNQDYYKPLDSFGNHRHRNDNEDIDAYASKRRYYD